MLKAVWQLLSSAEKTVYLATSVMDWNTTVDKVDVQSLLHRICSKGVQAQILLSENSGPVPSLPHGCTVRIVKNFGPKVENEMLFWTDTVRKVLTQAAQQQPDGPDVAPDSRASSVTSSDRSDASQLARLGAKPIYQFNQHYLMIDDRIVMFGPLQIIRAHSLLTYAQCVGAIVKTTRSFVHFVKKNFTSTGTALLPTTDLKGTHPIGGASALAHTPSAGTSTPSRGSEGVQPPSAEGNVLCAMIATARRYVYMETEHLISHNGTHNKVGKVLAERLIKAHRRGAEQDAFKCVLLVNGNPDPIHSSLKDQYVAKKLNITLQFLLDEFNRAGIRPVHFRNRIFVGVLRHHDVIAHSPMERDKEDSGKDNLKSKQQQSNVKHEPTFKYIRGLVCIQDGHNCLVSSSSICDRSLANQNSELGILIEDHARVSDLEQLLWRAHIQPHHSSDTKLITFNSLFDHCLNNTAHRIVKFKKWKTPLARAFQLSELMLSKVAGLSLFS